jgi:hypothetical protein
MSLTLIIGICMLFHQSSYLISRLHYIHYGISIHYSLVEILARLIYVKFNLDLEVLPRLFKYTHTLIHRLGWVFFLASFPHHLGYVEYHLGTHHLGCVATWVFILAEVSITIPEIVSETFCTIILLSLSLFVRFSSPFMA